jgi:hypothetical protein
VTDEASSCLEKRSRQLHESLAAADRLGAQGQLPDVLIVEGRLKIKALENSITEEAVDLMRQAYALLPRVKITDLLIEVDSWYDFTRHFSHLKSEEPPKNKVLVLSTVLADAINLGVTRMADARHETYTKARAQIVNYHHELAFAANFGQGTTSSSDAQRFRAGGPGEATGRVNPRYGHEPGALFYTHVSDQSAPFYSQVINATARDASYVLDGLLYHETDLQIEEHYTDTTGFTDHDFALCHLLGFRFAPRIRDLADKRLYSIEKPEIYPTIEPLIGARLDTKLIFQHWEDLLRLATFDQARNRDRFNYPSQARCLPTSKTGSQLRFASWEGLSERSSLSIF